MNHNHAAAGQHSCCSPKGKHDWLLIVTGVTIAVSYAAHLLLPHSDVPLSMFAMSIATTVNKIWWGILLGIVASGMLADVPREIVVGIFGRPGSKNGIARATFAGLLLDLCSHGILLVGMQLYKRGISLGQLMAFLIASPWNSLSLTLVLWGLVGLPWTLTIVVLSLVIGCVSGVLFDAFEKNGTLPKNPNSIDLPAGYSVSRELKTFIASRPRSFAYIFHLITNGFRESAMILRWIFFGVVFAALVQTFITDSLFASLFAPTITGLALTLLFATVIEVCSEGSSPVAADFLLRAHAGGNMFAFLMTGIATDYTEILSLKETTGSWKIALFLPLVTVPQVVVISLILNSLGT